MGRESGISRCRERRDSRLRRLRSRSAGAPRESGPLRKAKPGTIVAILSTIHPKTVQILAKECEGAGLHVVDSTVCRGGEAADSGTLLSFVAAARRSSRV